MQITGFDKIVNNYNTDIVYTQGDSVSVVAEATADVLAAVYVNVSDSTLTLGCKQDLQPAVFPGTLTLHVTAPGLYAVTNNCNMTLTADSLAAGNLTIDNRGAANIKLRCTVSGPVSISNYGNMQLDGALKAGNLEFVNNGACSLRADLRIHTGIELSNRPTVNPAPERASLAFSVLSAIRRSTPKCQSAATRGATSASRATR